MIYDEDIDGWIWLMVENSVLYMNTSNPNVQSFLWQQMKHAGDMVDRCRAKQDEYRDASILGKLAMHIGYRQAKRRAMNGIE